MAKPNFFGGVFAGDVLAGIFALPSSILGAAGGDDAGDFCVVEIADWVVVGGEGIEVDAVEEATGDGPDGPGGRGVVDGVDLPPTA